MTLRAWTLAAALLATSGAAASASVTPTAKPSRAGGATASTGTSFALTTMKSAPSPRNGAASGDAAARAANPAAATSSAHPTHAGLAAAVAHLPASETPAASVPQARVALEERLADAPFAIQVAAPAPATADAPRARRIVRLAIDAGSMPMDERASDRFASLDARLAWYRERNVDVWLALENLPIGTAAAADARGAAADAEANRGRSPAASASASRQRPGQAAQPSGASTADVRQASLARFVRALASHLGDHVRIVELALPRDGRDPVALAFDLKTLAVELHGARPALSVAIAAPDALALDALYTADLAPYLDAIVIAAGGDAAPTSRAAAQGSASDDDATTARVREARALLDKVDPTARVFERGLLLPAVAADAARRFTDVALRRLGGGAALTAFRAPTLDAARAVVRQADTLRALLEGEIAALDPNVANLTLTSPASPSSTSPAPRDTAPRFALVYNLTTFGTYLILHGTAPSAAPVASGTAGASTVRVSLTIATPARPNILDPDTGRSTPVQQFVRDEEARRTTFVAPLRPRPVVIDFNDAVEGLVTERSDVSGLAELSVEEIVARHQQRQAAQDAAVRRYTAAVRMEQHFRPTAADAGYDVVTENRFFVDDESVEWEELSFSVNGAKWTANRPAFPLLQPEKVLSVPLRLRLTADYRYRLAGRATIDGHDCYVVHFDPLDGGRSLYRGAVWIDVRTFDRRKLQTVQTNLVAPVVSNEETHEFIELPLPRAESRDGGADAQRNAEGQTHALLPSKVSARQILLIAGRNVLLEKITTFADYRINDERFAEQRVAARAGERIMYRDTERGVRYLVKEGEAGERVVSEQMTARAKAMAMGVNIDPSYDFPLPILGINYLDFAFRGPDSQLAILFGGVLALGNIQRPKLFGTKLDGSVDFFAIAVPGNDRTYDAEGVRKQDELLTWPLSAGLNLGYQFTSFQKLTGQYQFQFNGYLKNRETTEDYHVPSSTVTNGVGLAYEYRRAGYSFVANGTYHGRLNWKPWGQADALQTTPRTYTKYSVNLSKDWYAGLFHKIHVNGAYFGGRDLDRFSQYQFGMFDDTRVHGVPAAGVRYGELAMARGSYSFNLFEQYRFDLFLEQVFARDPAAGVSAGPAARASLAAADADRKPWDPITGVGVAFTVKAPFNTLLRADVGKAFLPDRYRATGSTVVSVLFLKPL